MRAIEMLVVIGVVAIAVLVPLYYYLKRNWFSHNKRKYEDGYRMGYRDGRGDDGNP